MTETYIDINGRLRKKLIRPVEIMIIRAEGPSSLCGKVQIAYKWVDADLILRNNSTSAPKGGAYDKHDFKIIFENGVTYHGRYDLKHWEEETPDLRGNVLSFMRYLAGVAPSWMTGEKLVAHRADMKNRTKEIEKAKIWLETYDAGQEPPFLDKEKP